MNVEKKTEKTTYYLTLSDKEYDAIRVALGNIHPSEYKSGAAKPKYEDVDSSWVTFIDLYCDFVDSQ